MLIDPASATCSQRRRASPPQVGHSAPASIVVRFSRGMTILINDKSDNEPRGDLALACENYSSHAFCECRPQRQLDAREKGGRSECRRASIPRVMICLISTSAGTRDPNPLLLFNFCEPFNHSVTLRTASKHPCRIMTVIQSYVKNIPQPDGNSNFAICQLSIVLRIESCVSFQIRDIHGGKPIFKRFCPLYQS